jgi:hypothetical protein
MGGNPHLAISYCVADELQPTPQQVRIEVQFGFIEQEQSALQFEAFDLTDQKSDLALAATQPRKIELCSGGFKYWSLRIVSGLGIAHPGESEMGQYGREHLTILGHPICPLWFYTTGITSCPHCLLEVCPVCVLTRIKIL